MFAYKTGAAIALFLTMFAAGTSQAADLDTAYNDPACMSPADYAGLTGSTLARSVAADVAANPECARNACSVGLGIAASPVSSNSTETAVITPVASGASAVGAGLGQAYQQFAGAGDVAAAGMVADAGCGCGGSVTGSFVGSVGGQACDIAYGSETTYGGMGAVGSLFYIRAVGGGGGTPQSPN